MPREIDIQFQYEVDALGVVLDCSATLRLPPRGHTHPNDPDNDAELFDLTAIGPDGDDALTDEIKVRTWNAYLKDHEWRTLTDLLTERAWEVGMRERSAA